MSKAEIVRYGMALGAPLELTWSCYAGGERPCGVCDSCQLRAAGFAAAGLADPALEAG
jgi:7-cyano-7-deazaguanine synthase